MVVRHRFPLGSILVTSAIWLILALPGFAADTAAFSGVVVTDTGALVAGARILYNNVGVCTPDSLVGYICRPPTVSTSTQTAGDGRFSATALPAGFFYLCVLPVAANQLGSCDWGKLGGDPGPTTVTLAEGQQINDLRFILRTGTLGVFKIRDDRGFLAGGWPFAFGVSTDSGGYYGAVFDSSRQAYILAMPKGISLRLFIDTPGLSVFNDAGESLPLRASSMQFNTGTGDELTINLTVAAPLVNAASYSPGVNAHSIASIFGTGFTTVQGIQAATSLPLPTQIAGTSVTVGGVPAPLFAVANQNGQEQINFQVPNTFSSIVVNNNGRTQTFYAHEGGAPGIFVTNGQPAVQHASGAFVSASNPATSGETIVFYWTGIDFFPRVPAGVASPSSPLALCTPPPVEIGGVAANVSFCGGAPGFVGLGQINLAVPPTLRPGTYDLRFRFSPGPWSNAVPIPVQ